MLLYSLLTAAALGLSAPVWGLRMLRRGRYREGLRQRLGTVPRELAEAARGRQVVWFHAVSVGETVAAARLVEQMRQALPGAVMVVSTTTATGQAVARERFGSSRVFFYPLDFAFAVRRYLGALRPALVVLMESELWPRMLVECERAGVPVAVVNARVSDRSLPRYMLLRRLWRPLLAKVGLLLAQSETDARRWVEIGASADRVRAVGNLKYDAGDAPESGLAVALREHLDPLVPVLVAGSTHAGEEEMLLRCCAGGELRLLLAPRHPERTEEVAAAISAAGLLPVRLGGWRAQPRAFAPREVLLLDTVGELAALYRLATAAFVGGSLVPTGGHNPLEPARFGIPVLMGPHFENFREIVYAMREAGALRIAEEGTLCGAIEDALNHGEDVAGAERVRAFFTRESGATGRTVAALVDLLEMPSRVPGA